VRAGLGRGRWKARRQPEPRRRAEARRVGGYCRQWRSLAGAGTLSKAPVARASSQAAAGDDHYLHSFSCRSRQGTEGIVMNEEITNVVPVEGVVAAAASGNGSADYSEKNVQIFKDAAHILQ